jgi:hypothetical protein
MAANELALAPDPGPSVSPMHPDPELPEPTLDDAIRLVQGHLALTLDDDPAAIAQLAAIGIVNQAWRNTYLEALHAGDHPSGGFPDTDMMRFNIATTRAVAKHVTAERVDWEGLADQLLDPDRPLPGGHTVRRLAGGELPELLESFDHALAMLELIEQERGFAFALLRVALIGGASCKDWYGTPWWPDVVDAFADMLVDPSSAAWERDDRSQAKPASVADRDALADVLIGHPEDLDDDGIRWCHAHGLAHRAPFAGFARWRRRREPGWSDPQAWLYGDA